MNDERRDPPRGVHVSPVTPTLNMTPVDIPGGTRTDFPDGGHLIEGPAGEKSLVSESGAVTWTVPVTRRSQVEDLSRVSRREVA